MEVAESGTGGQVAPVGGSIIVGDQRIRERRKVIVTLWTKGD